LRQESVRQESVRQEIVRASANQPIGSALE
jgi:hypothetical protein